MSTTPAFDSATAAHAIPADALSHRWSRPTRILFRFAFCYFGLYCLCNGNATLWDVLPVIGDRVQEWLADIFILPAQYLAQHLFHVPPPGNKLHPTGSGDTAIIWVALLIIFVVSILITVIWSLLAERRPTPRPHYQTLLAWLRFIIRLTLGCGMVGYGLAKLFPMQMRMPNITQLSEPFGLHSPMAILWQFIGTNPVYEMICGGAEFLGGILILFRRTALAGAIVIAFVVTNVLLYNLCFDVPVKVYAGHLLLLSLFVILPDVQPLYRFFWLHQPAAPTGVWVPPSSRRWFRVTTIAVEILFTVLTIATTTWFMGPEWHKSRLESRIPAPLRGAWRIDSATLTAPTGATIPNPLLSEPDSITKQRHPFLELDINDNTGASFRDDTGRDSWFQIKTDSQKHTLTFTRPDKSTVTYLAVSPDPTHLILTPTGPETRTASKVSLTLVSPPQGYPLLTRGFHWVSEYPYQR